MALFSVSGGMAARAGGLEQLDHFSVEGWNVIGLTARDQFLVDDRFLVHPIRSGVRQIRLSDSCCSPLKCLLICADLSASAAGETK
jgi:hypothetical protein